MKFWEAVSLLILLDCIPFSADLDGIVWKNSGGSFLVNYKLFSMSDALNYNCQNWSGPLGQIRPGC